MKLSSKTITTLAEMICGRAGAAGFKWPNFPYRSTYYLTEFFRACNATLPADLTRYRSNRLR